MRAHVPLCALTLCAALVPAAGFQSVPPRAVVFVSGLQAPIASERPPICVIDEAQWLDRVSTQNEANRNTMTRSASHEVDKQ